MELWLLQILRKTGFSLFFPFKLISFVSPSPPFLGKHEQREDEEEEKNDHLQEKRENVSAKEEFSCS